MTPDQRELLGDLLKAISRIERKSEPGSLILLCSIQKRDKTLWM